MNQPTEQLNKEQEQVQIEVGSVVTIEYRESYDRYPPLTLVVTHLPGTAEYAVNDEFRGSLISPPEMVKEHGEGSGWFFRLGDVVKKESN